MIRCLLAIVWLLAGIAVAKADERFERANAEFEAGRFEAAAETYEELLEEGPRVAVLQNLGSAYFRLEDYGRAILAFERARVLEPGDPDLRANLKLARDQAAVFAAEEQSGWMDFHGRLSRRNWSWIALAAATLLPASALAWLLTRRKRGRAGLVAGTVSAAALSVTGLSLHVLDSRQDDDARGIVIASPATVRISPFATAGERATLAAGREVTLVRKENGYFWATSTGGETEGWVAAGEVERVIPSSGR